MGVIFFSLELIICMSALMTIMIVDGLFQRGGEATGTVVGVESKRNGYDLVLDVDGKEAMLFGCKLHYRKGTKLHVLWYEKSVFGVGFVRARLITDTKNTWVVWAIGAMIGIFGLVVSVVLQCIGY